MLRRRVEVAVGLALRRPQVAAGHFVPVGLILPAPAETAREIIEDLEAALEQFRLIEADLNPGTDRED